VAALFQEASGIEDGVGGVVDEDLVGDAWVHVRVEAPGYDVPAVHPRQKGPGIPAEKDRYISSGKDLPLHQPLHHTYSILYTQQLRGIRHGTRV